MESGSKEQRGWQTTVRQTRSAKAALQPHSLRAGQHQAWVCAPSVLRALYVSATVYDGLIPQVSSKAEAAPWREPTIPRRTKSSSPLNGIGGKRRALNSENSKHPHLHSSRWGGGKATVQLLPECMQPTPRLPCCDGGQGAATPGVTLYASGMLTDAFDADRLQGFPPPARALLRELGRVMVPHDGSLTGGAHAVPSLPLRSTLRREAAFQTPQGVKGA